MQTVTPFGLRVANGGIMTLFRRLLTSTSVVAVLLPGMALAPASAEERPAPEASHATAQATAAPDATATPTATATPDASATPEPDATATPEPDATATPEATQNPRSATPTPVPTPTATATPAPTHTPAPTPTAPAETLTPDASASPADPVIRPMALTAPRPAVLATGGGWGHSVGMSQYGAYAQALQGWSAAEILRHWYPGVNVTERTGTTTQDIRVNLSTTTTRSDVRVERGGVGWILCTPDCTDGWIRDDDGDRIPYQTPADGTWSVTVDEDTGEFRISAGGEVIWSGGDAFSYLRARLSVNEGEDTVVSAVGGRYKWGFLEFQSHSQFCAAPAMCANLEVPSLEKYLYGLAEMPSSWHAEALKAQATVGRSYALRKIHDFNGGRTGCLCDVYATPRDQAFAGYKKEEGALGRRWAGAVDQSAGRLVTYGGSIAETYYSSSHSDRTENVDDSWAFSTPLSQLPYLASVPDRWSDAPAVKNPYADWTAELGNREFAEYVGSGFDTITGIQVLTRTQGGTPKEILVRGYDASGERVEQTFDGHGAKGIVGAEMRQTFGLRSQQIETFGFPPFTDDNSSVHEYAITALAHNGVTNGCASDRFCPRADIDRAQIAALLAKALNLSPSSRDAFSDDDGLFHEGNINAIAAAGVTTGCGGGRYCPGASLTRAQMASLLVRAFDLPPAQEDWFADDAGSAHEANINALAARGITLGRAGGGFGPAKAVTRAEMATFLARALGLAV